MINKCFTAAANSAPVPAWSVTAFVFTAAIDGVVICFVFGEVVREGELMRLTSLALGLPNRALNPDADC